MNQIRHDLAQLDALLTVRHALEYLEQTHDERISYCNNRAIGMLYAVAELIKWGKDEL